MLNCGGYFTYRRRQSSASETSFEIKIGRRLLSEHSVVLLIYHCYELLNALFIHCYLFRTHAISELVALYTIIMHHYHWHGTTVVLGF
jgi:hypothetical protein